MFNESCVFPIFQRRINFKQLDKHFCCSYTKHIILFSMQFENAHHSGFSKTNEQLDFYYQKINGRYQKLYHLLNCQLLLRTLQIIVLKNNAENYGWLTNTAIILILAGFCFH